MKLPWFNNANFVIALVPDIFFVGKSAEGSKVIVTLLLPQMAENSDTRSSLLGENKLQHLSNKWRNKNTTYSTKLALILIKLGRLNTRRILIWMSICHLNFIKYYVNFIENFDELVERYRTLFT